MHLLRVILFVVLSACAVGATEASPSDLAASRRTKEGRQSVRWIECHYENWTALACWRHSDTEGHTLVQVFIPGADSEWKLIFEEKIRYAKELSERVSHLDAVPHDRIFMVIDRSGLLVHSILGYERPNQPPQPTR